MFSLGVEPRLESLAVIECDFGRGLVSNIGVMGAWRICGNSKGRWNPGKTDIMSQEAVLNGVDFYHLQAVIEFIEHHCAVWMVSQDGNYPSLCWHIRVCLLFSALPLVSSFHLILPV